MFGITDICPKGKDGFASGGVGLSIREAADGNLRWRIVEGNDLGYFMTGTLGICNGQLNHIGFRLRSGSDEYVAGICLGRGSSITKVSQKTQRLLSGITGLLAIEGNA